MENTDLAKADTTSQTAGETAPAEVKTETATPPATTEATATAPETKTSTEKTAEPYRETGSPAVGVEGYQKALDEALALSAKKQAEEKQSKVEAAKAQDKIDSGQVAATEDETKPPAEAAAATETPVTETPAVETATDATKDTEKDPPSRIRIGRLPEKDRSLIVAATELAAAKSIPFEEAWAKVNEKAPEPTAEKTDKPALRTRAEIESDIATTKAAKKKAATDLDTGAMYEADEKIETLREELKTVEQSEVEAGRAAAAAEQKVFTDTVAKARAKAINDWPEAGEENSEFVKRMDELTAELEKDPDPELRSIVFEADAPYVIAKMVAKEQGLLPKHLRKTAPAKNGATESKPSTPAAAAKPAPVNQRAVGRPAQPAATPASGAARTTQGGSAADTLGLDKIHSVTDYEKAVERAKQLSAAHA